MGRTYYINTDYPYTLPINISKATPIKITLELKVVELSSLGISLDPIKFHVEITIRKLQIFLTTQFDLELDPLCSMKYAPLHTHTHTHTHTLFSPGKSDYSAAVDGVGMEL
jgi:hypothetical protein